MRKIALLVIALLLTGCTNKISFDDEKMTSYCDEKYGVEYIKINGLYGMSIRLDKNGDVIHCEVNK